MDFLLIPHNGLNPDKYSLHALVLRGFYGFRNSPVKPRVLFRLDDDGLHMRCQIQPRLGFDDVGTLLSAETPDLSKASQVLVRLSPQMRHKGKFSRCADPVAFCRSKLEQAGLEVQDLEISNPEWSRLYQRRTGTVIGFPCVDCCATVRVVNLEAFIKAYHEGLGREKGFDLGMMVVR